MRNIQGTKNPVCLFKGCDIRKGGKNDKVWGVGCQRCGKASYPPKEN